MNRRSLLLSALLPGLARAQGYPSRPIRLVLPVVAAGAVDISIRILAPKLTELLGQPMVVDPRPGGAGALASELVAHAAPDGHTLLIGTVNGLAVNPNLFRNLAVDPVRDLAPVTTLVHVLNLLAVPTDRPWRSVAELVAALKAAPGTLTYGSAAIGSAGHLAGALLDFRAGTEAVHVPYRGGGQLITDLMSGKLDYGFATAATVLPFVESGQLRALAVPTAARSRLLPDLPTVAESGVPGYAIDNWYAVCAPRATPAPVIEVLNAAFGAALADREVVRRLGAQGLEPFPSSPAEFGAFLRAEVANYGTLVRAAGIEGN
jgi:tripartite-type tricarboxylate transporter receptor subunit TctC